MECWSVQSPSYSALQEKQLYDLDAVVVCGDGEFHGIEITQKISKVVIVF